MKFLKVRNNFQKHIWEIFRFKKGEGGTQDWEGWSEMEEAATGGLQLETLAHEFSCEFCEISKNTLFTEHLQTTSSQEHFAQKWKNQPQEACNFIKKETLAHVFSCEFCEISKNTFFTEHL